MRGTIGFSLSRASKPYSLLVSHLHMWLEEKDKGGDALFPNCLLRHKAAVHLLSAVTSSESVYSRSLSVVP